MLLKSFLFKAICVIDNKRFHHVKVTVKDSEAVVCRCFSRQVFLKILQILQENTCVWVSF